MSCEIIYSVDQGVERAIEVINNGGVAILPADTVYGLFAKATCKEAVERVYSIKKREMRKPFVIYTNKNKVGDVCKINGTAKSFIDSVWPKALALILPKRESVPDWFTNDMETVAVMTAQNELITKVIGGVEAPIFGTTVNISGEPELKTGEGVMPFIDQVDLLVHKDDLIVYNKPSTMVDCTVTPPKIARLSALSVDLLKRVVPDLQVDLKRRIS